MRTNSKYIALISLAIMAAGFLLTLPYSNVAWVRFLQAGFEAGLVGGLADWFAVTALFRHPLGIPIPHTALLPRNRKRVTKALVDTVENELLSKDSIRSKLDQFSISTRLLDGLETHVGSDEVKMALAALCEHAVREIPLAPLVPMLEREIRKQAEVLDTKRLLSIALEHGIANKWDEKAFDYVLVLAEQYVMEERTAAKMGAMASQALAHFQTNGFMQFALNAFVGFFSEEKLGATIQQFLLSRIAELGIPGHPTRTAVLEAIRARLEHIPQREETVRALDDWKRDMLAGIDLSAKLESMLEQLREQLLEMVRRDTFPDEVLVPFIQRGIRTVRSDEGLIGRMETFIHDRLAAWVEKHHHKIGRLIEENISRYDDATLISLMEDKLGRDLQWIRVNGAICGFLIGLVLFSIRLLAG